MPRVKKDKIVELYTYDLALCRYACDVIEGHMLGADRVGEPTEKPTGSDTSAKRAIYEARYVDVSTNIGVARWMYDSLDRRLWRFIKGVEKMPLSGDELEMLADTVFNGPCTHALDWTADLKLHRLHTNYLAVIRERHATATAERFARLCEALADRLESDGCKVHEGIQIIAEWVREIRLLLKFSSQGDLLPPPEGYQSTPTHPVAEPPDNLKRPVARMRKAFVDNPGHKYAKGWALVEVVGIRKTDGLAALRWLKDRGEYFGTSEDVQSN